MNHKATDRSAGSDLPRSDVERLIDLQRYPIHVPDSQGCIDLVQACRQQLADQAIASLPGFVRADAIDALAEEAMRLVRFGHRFDQPRTTNFDDPEHDGPAEELTKWQDLRHQAHDNRYCQVLNHHIPNYSDVRAIYLWPELTEFVRRVLGEETLYPSRCPHLALSMKVAFDGDQDGWHYDPNDGVITLMLQTPDQGGEFEYAPYIRSAGNQNYEAVTKVFEEPDQFATRRRLEAGTFTLFNGRRSMHRVRQSGPTAKPRVVAIFCYDRRPDQVFSQNYIDLVRSFPQGPPSAAQEFSNR